MISAPYIKHLPLEEVSLASALKEGGYTTYHVGKWHLGGEEYSPVKHGFDINIGGSHYGSPRFGYFSPYHLPNLEDGPKGEYLTDRLTDEAINLIHKENSRPYFLYMSYYSVHTPIQAPEHLVKKYEQKRKKMGLDKVQEFAIGERFPCEHKKFSRIRRRLVQSDPDYAAMVETLDTNIGRLLNAVKDAGEEDKTIVIFTSDNGGLATAEGSPTTNTPLSEGKGWMYEGGTREPLMIRWPGVTEQGTASSEPVSSPDFYPTILEMAGLEPRPRQYVDGVSLVPILKHKKAELEREGIFWHYPHYGNQGGTPGSSIRSGAFKLIEFFEDGRLELYNLEDDISEEYNLSTDDPDRTTELHQRLKEWRENVDAKIPKPNPDYGKPFKNLKDKIIAAGVWFYYRYLIFKSKRKK